MMELGLSQKTVLVTGASAGIGKSIANGFYDAGCVVHMVSRSLPNLELAAQDFKGGDYDRIQLHVEDISSPGAAVRLHAAIGTPDILINNAGAITGGDLESVTEEIWRKGWDLKVFGYINTCRVFLSAMVKRGDGVIINITGLAADRYDAGYISGTAGNASLNAFTKAVGGKSLNQGIRVLAVSPGPVATERLVKLMRTRAKTEYGDSEKWQTYFANFPNGRAASVQEIADVVIFMASERASFVSGTVVTVDGGHGSNIPTFA